MRISDWSSDVCSSDLAEFGKQEPKVTEKGVAAVDRPAQDRSVSLRGKSIHDQAGAEQCGGLLGLLDQSKGEEASEIDHRHCSEIDGFAGAQRRQDVASMAIAAGDRPDDRKSARLNSSP